jgi:hypothetical protein
MHYRNPASLLTNGRHIHRHRGNGFLPQPRKHLIRFLVLVGLCPEYIAIKLLAARCMSADLSYHCFRHTKAKHDRDSCAAHGVGRHAIVIVNWSTPYRCFGEFWRFLTSL